MVNLLKEKDVEIHQLIKKEAQRQNDNIELIASENFVSTDVLEVQGSILTNKYAEGYPNKRYYGGCEFVDQIEDIARERVKKLFGAEHANVQPHSGSQANAAVYNALLNPGDTVLGMDLSHGGHLTHGSSVNFSGKTYNFVSYGVEKGNEQIDYDKLRKLALEHKPKLIVAGASAYSQIIDFEKFRNIAEEVGSLFMVDMAHIAGLVVAGLHPNPVPFADVVTSTTHKTLRGPRGGIILSKEKYAKQIDKAIFPGIQGGPLMHVIAAKAIAFKEAMTLEFKEYMRQVVKNANVLSKELGKKGIKTISGGTQNHLFLIDVKSIGITGKLGEELLDKVGITVNKNTIPFETESPFVTSGIRIGTPAVTTRGMKENEMKKLAEIIANVLKNPEDENIQKESKEKVQSLTKDFPLYQE